MVFPVLRTRSMTAGAINLSLTYPNATVPTSSHPWERADAVVVNQPKRTIRLSLIKVMV